MLLYRPPRSTCLLIYLVGNLNRLETDCTSLDNATKIIFKLFKGQIKLKKVFKIVSKAFSALKMVGK